MERPNLSGLWHVALNVVDVERALTFYVGDLGLTVEWRPDPDNVYLTSGRDNLALHRVDALVEKQHGVKERLDHVGFVVPTAAAVDAWGAWLESRGHALAQAPKTHRDGARSLYVRDPAGNLVQFIHHPPLAGLARQVVS
jgi:catechol 2,3-dioxygenase-like lactoylglutathione lyase family enzyme